MMFDLVIAACAFVTSGAPVCKERVVGMNGATKLQCIQSAQINMAQWASKHEGWKITRYECAVNTGKA
jgi:hypothetical protein